MLEDNFPRITKLAFSQIKTREIGMPRRLINSLYELFFINHREQYCIYIIIFFVSITYAILRVLVWNKPEPQVALEVIVLSCVLLVLLSLAYILVDFKADNIFSGMTRSLQWANRVLTLHEQKLESQISEMRDKGRDSLAAKLQRDLEYQRLKRDLEIETKKLALEREEILAAGDMEQMSILLEKRRNLVMHKYKVVLCLLENEKLLAQKQLEQQTQEQEAKHLKGKNIRKSKAHRRAATVKRETTHLKGKNMPLERLSAEEAMKQIRDTTYALQEFLLEDELVQKMQQAMQQLPEPIRLCVDLRVFGALQEHEIAKAMGISVEQVTSNLFQARARLRVLLGENYEALRRVALQ